MPLRKRRLPEDAFGQAIGPDDDVVCICGFTAAQEIGEITVTPGTILKGDSPAVRRLPHFFAPVSTSEERRRVAFARAVGAA